MNNIEQMIIRMFGSMQNFQQQFANFQQRMGNINPQQEVQDLLNSRKMSQQQFNTFRMFANQMTGRRM